jgi:peptidyl-prolyl cis-trans isomerase SurA
VKLKLSIAAVFTLAAVLFLPSIATAQEGEPVVVDEVIAQVNDGVVTLSQLKREMKERVETMKHNGMTEQQATAEVEKHKAELIATLINEQLLLQKGKELDFSERVEAQVNRRMLEVAQENKIPSIEKLEEAMRQSGVDPATTRQTMRTEMMKQAVLESEVDSKIFYGLTADELRQYFDSHRDKFITPEAIELSEIFLSLAGKKEPEVKTLAMQLVTQIRSGADFGTLATSYSEREEDKKAKGKLGLFELANLNPEIRAAVKNVPAGGVTDPVKTDEGYFIFRVDSRAAGSPEPKFNELKVREAITMERIPKEREKFVQDLRNDAYVSVAESYRDSVMPLLNIVPPAAATKDSSKKDKKNAKP